MTIAEKMRKAAKQLKRFDFLKLCEAMGVRTYSEQRLVKANIKAFLKRGEFKILLPERFLYIERERATSLKQRLWDIARRMIYFCASDLEQITEGNKNTIQDFIKWMLKNGYAERVERGKYRTVGKLKPDVPGTKKRE